ncbi:MAG: peptidoglycan DD-metalloendopeptidase family protein [Chitinophagaceae bacterium]|nr:peptidoglycan DD-metalloendopeptidase family protein [Chitinophagaceae bacterium]
MIAFAFKCSFLNGQSSLYKLPFPTGTSYACNQGNNNQDYSHNGINQYAYDFDLPIGTPVCAMREGKVVDVVENYQNGNCHYTYPSCTGKCVDNNCDPCGNFVNRVVVEHSDGTRAQYLHLNPNSVYVSPNDSVLQGQVLALSGNSGCSTNPHLHIMLMNMAGCANNWYCQSIPISFCDQTPALQPQEGFTYTAQNCNPSICATVTNNSCLNPLNLQENSTCVFTNGSVCEAAPSKPFNNIPDWVIPGAVAQDVWYRFYPTTGDPILKVQSGTDMDIIVQVFSQVSCSTSYVELAHTNNTGIGGLETINFQNLNIGGEYWIRLYKNVSGGGGSTLHRGTDFQICLQSNVVTSVPDLDTIPVVFHIMHKGGAVGSLFNPSDEQIKMAMDTLNAIYSGNFPGSDLGVAETGIRFALASNDPSGNCTSGITRHDLSLNSDYVNYGIRYESTDPACGIDDVTLKNIERWNPAKYLNIWLVHQINNGGANGCPQFGAFVSTFPNNDYEINKDGVVLNVSYISNLLGQNISGKSTPAHEIGHYLNLYHVFEGGNLITPCPADIQILCSTIGDKVCDTDPVSRNDGAPRVGENDCMIFSTSYSDNTERNIMSYTSEAVLFTAGQKQRMLNCLQSSIRNSLIVNNNALSSPNTDLMIDYPNITNNGMISSANTSVPVSITFYLRNIGQIASAPNYISIHLSPDDVLTPGSNGDQFLTDIFYSSSLPALNTSSLLSVTFNLPANLPLGSYRAFISADGLQQVTECNETNNYASVPIHIVDSSSVSSFRYWFDDAFNQAVYVNEPVDNLNKQIPLNNLSNGLHTIHFQFKGYNDNWSSISSNLFINYKNTNTAKMRYWFDDNFSQAITNNITSANSYDISPNVNIASLTNGLHTFNFQLRTTNAEWSCISSNLFIKLPIETSTNNIVEYWFDDNYTSSIIDTLAAGSVISYLDSILVASLSNGLHTINSRFKLSNANWSSISSNLFIKEPTTLSPVTEVQYWFDDNYVSAMTNTLTNSNAINYLDNILVTTLTNGLHTLNTRFKISNDTWSSISSNLFIKEATSLSPVTQVQYWFDDNYASSITLSLGSINPLNYQDQIDVVSLTAGSHVINYRFKVNSDQWSSIVRSTFTKTNNYTPITVKMLIQGYYDGNALMKPVLYNQGVSSNTNIADSVTIEFRDTTSPYNLVSSRKVILPTNGVANTIAPGTSGAYYIKVNHRNAIETWSGLPFTVVPNGFYDFTTAANQAFGSNQTQVEPGIWALYSGDINQDGAIDAFDYLIQDPDIIAGASGYLSTDLNGDGIVDVFDYLVMEPNLTEGIGAITP